MDYLLEFADRDEVRELAGVYLEQSDAVQGLAVDLDECPGGVDPHWRTESWERVAERRGVGPDPFVLVVVLRQDVHPERLAGLREIDPGGIQVRFEARPTPRLFAKPTDRVRPLVGGLSVSAPAGRAGTLGGIVRGVSGDWYGTTCSHVIDPGSEAQQPSPADNRREAMRIGTCVEASDLASHVPPLNPYGETLNTVDIALVELDQGVEPELGVLGVGELAGIAAKTNVNPGASVEVVGKEAGQRTLYVGAVTLAQEFEFAGRKYGFQNLFELKRFGRFAGITGTLSRPVKAGDSGAWVLREGTSGPEWLGVVIGGMGPYGYATPAELVADWIDAQTGLGPVVVG